MKAIRYIFIVAFFGFLVLPWLNGSIPILNKVVSTENRALTKFPEIDTCDMDKFPLYLENYLTDQLSTRNNWIRFYNRLNIFVFKSSPVSLKGFVGKNNWLFLAGEELKTYAGTALFSQDELTEFKTEMLRRKKIISAYKAKLLIAIVPNKSNIYPEFMPNYLRQSEHGGYGQQLHRFLKENGLPVIDLYSSLLNNKTRDVYFKTDNHWNDFGAFIACNEILKQMQSSFASVKLLDTLLHPIKTYQEKPGCIASQLSIEKETSDMNYHPSPILNKTTLVAKKKYPVMKDFPYGDEYETVYMQSDTTLPKVLLIRDSFGKRLIPYLAEECSKCTAIWDGWHYGLNEDIIKDTKPNFVIYLISESQLKNVMKYQREKTTL